MLLTIIGDSEVSIDCGEPTCRAATTQELKSLNMTSDESSTFLEYFWTANKEVEASVLTKVTSSGDLTFVYRADTGYLYSETTYTVTEKLSDIELAALIDYTQGQWSDGIGECFEQIPHSTPGGNEAYISAWHRKQVVRHEYSNTD